MGSPFVLCLSSDRLRPENSSHRTAEAGDNSYAAERGGRYRLRKLLGARTSSRRFDMCWSKYEREEWERLQLERELASLRTISTEPEAAEEPAAPEEVEEREDELVRV